MAPDVIVVGGGTAGCVVAAILSEDPACEVLLLEAGPDFPTVADLPADVANGAEPTVNHDWGFVAERNAWGREIALPRAKLVGGCSATNAAFWFRGWPADYDGWAAAGNPGWSYDDLLPTMQALGSVPLTHVSEVELAPLQSAFIEAALAAGQAAVDDHNRPGPVGVGPMTRNTRDGVRMSTAQTHLAAARSRPNLTITPDVLVDRIELTGAKVRGVRLADGRVLEAPWVVLAAGAYCSPTILMRSGVGPQDWMRDAGITRVVDIEGVGSNLSDHPLVAVDLPTDAAADVARFQVVLTARSSHCDPAAPPDLHLFPAGPFPAEGVPGTAVFGIVTALLAPRARGSVRIRSADPNEPPSIRTPLLDHGEDVARMVDATLLARTLSRTPPLAGFVSADELEPGSAILDDDHEGLARSIRGRVASYHHPVGTCAMGPDPDGGAVVDATGAVYGVEGLWVADASVMPTIPSAGTNMSTILVATKIAEGLR